VARILVVEDESIVALDIQKILSEMGHEVPSPVVNGKDCIESASQCCPDLVLMDIRIRGDQDGIATATILRDRFDVPIVYLTAHADDETISRAKITAPFGYLLKPFKSAELKSVIEIALSKHDMERKIRRREKWLSTSLQAVGDAVIAVNKAGEIFFMNAAAESITGYLQKDVEGKKLIDVMPLINEKTRELVQTPIIRILKEKKILNLPSHTSLISQQYEWPIEKSAAILDDSGELSGAVIVFRSEERDRARIAQQSAIADRLTSLGSLVSGVAHEINNPLAVVVANATFVCEELEKNMDKDNCFLKEAIDSMKDIQFASERIRKIVSDLKFFSQPQTEIIKPVDINELLEWAVRLTSNQIRHCGVLKKKFTSKSMVSGSELRLGQVFANIILNATQSMEALEFENNLIEISTSDQNGYVVVEIRDTGCGMSPEVMKRIFDPFFTTKPAGVGTGLGLSISRGIIHSMEGTIEVKSLVGKGSTFKVQLPRFLENHSEMDPEKQEILKLRKSKVLIVDDEPLLLKLIYRTLSEDHEVVVKESSVEALQFIRANPSFDIILCDLMMPEMSGMELFDKVTENLPEMSERFAFMTGGAFTDTANQFIENMTNKKLDKPFTPSDLKVFVKQFLAEKTQDV
jgi:two-component system cell cycle sensor histidine kinase/response regulator CckA